MFRICSTIVLCVLVTTGLVCLSACTKKVVSQRGIYSSQQLPKETQTPILDAFGDILGPNEDR